MGPESDVCLSYLTLLECSKYKQNLTFRSSGRGPVFGSISGPLKDWSWSLVCDFGGPKIGSNGTLFFGAGGSWGTLGAQV